MFPGNFVELLPDGVESVPATKERKCRAIFDFKADSEDELTINEGDIIIIESGLFGIFVN